MSPGFDGGPSHDRPPEYAADIGAFHRGETVAVLAPEGSACSAANEAATRVAENLQGSNECIIRAGVEAVEAKVEFGNDATAYRSFIAALVVKNVLTRNDGEVATSESSKSSKLQTVGRHADILRREEILPRLPHGYSALYAAVVLFKKLPGDENERYNRLVEILIEGERQQEISRQFLIDQGREADINKKPPKAKTPSEKPERADLILATPGPREIRRLGLDVTEDSLPACRRLGDLAADKADAVIIVPMSELALVKSRMIDECGFAVERVLLLSRPDAPDITDADVVLIAARGAGEHEIGPFQWSDDSAEIDPLELARHLFPYATRKVRLFADRPEGDWDALVGEDNWRTGRE